MRNALKNDILPNEKILEPYDIDIALEKRYKICKSYIDVRDTERRWSRHRGHVYSISEIDFFKSMFNNINVMRS